MSIAFRSVSEAETSGAGSGLTVPAPAGVQDGDILIAFGNVAFHAGSATGLTVAGFTSIRNFDNPAGNNAGGYLFKRAGPSEPGSYAFDFTSANSGLNRVGCIIAVSGAVVTGSPVHAEAISAEASGSGATLDVTCPDVVVTEISLVLQLTFWFMGFASITVARISGAASTERVDNARSFADSQGSTVDAIGSSNPGTTTYRGTQSAPFSATAFGATIAIEEALPPSGAGGGMGGPGKKPITKADVLAAREQAIAVGAKVRTKFDPRRR